MKEFYFMPQGMIQKQIITFYSTTNNYSYKWGSCMTLQELKVLGNSVGG